MLNKKGVSNKQQLLDLQPKKTILSFRGAKKPKKQQTEERSVITMLTPSLVNFLDNKFRNHKEFAFENLKQKFRALKFAQLYKSWNNKQLYLPKRDMIDLMKAEHIYMNGLVDSNVKLFNLLRRYWIKSVTENLKAPSRIYRILYMIKVVMMHKAIAYQRFIRELLRKWRFTTFIHDISRRKIELLYKDLHVAFLQMTNTILGDKGPKDASIVKEFERLSSKMGLFRNEDYSITNEENFCDKITKKYVFQPMQVLLEKDGPSSYFFNSGSGIEVEDSGENNKDYYIDQDNQGETIGKYKQDTSKSGSRFDRRY